MEWWLWLLLGVMALAAESLSGALFLAYAGLAACAVALPAALGGPPALQAGLFVALAALLLGLVRPRTLHALGGRVPARLLTNQGALADRLAVVIQTVTADSGAIRLGNAEFWTARVNPPTRSIGVGEPVRVVYVAGLTAFVTPVHETAAAPHAPSAAALHLAAREER